MDYNNKVLVTKGSLAGKIGRYDDDEVENGEDCCIVYLDGEPGYRIIPRKNLQVFDESQIITKNSLELQKAILNNDYLRKLSTLDLMKTISFYLFANLERSGDSDDITDHHSGRAY